MSLFERILVPLDGSPLADRILHQIRPLLKTTDGEVWLLRVMPEYLVEGSGWVPERVTEEIERHLERLRDDLVAAGVKAFSKIRTGDPAHTILDEAKQAGASCIAMSTHGRSGLGRWLMGSVAERVLREAPVPVFLANRATIEQNAQGEPKRVERVLVPLDGSDNSAAIVPVVAEVGRAFGAEAVLLHVQSLYPAGPDPYFVAMPPIPTVEEGQALIAPFAEQLTAAGVRSRSIVMTDRAAACILETAEKESVGLIAMTTHGYTGLARWAYGSVAEKVLRHAPCPLLVLRRPGQDGGDADAE